ncbi:MAG TPA: GIY-YIG nuclease family protein [Candidatus Acidoferrales bacterium]|nr:GIY-YIG nuclease family protein [Candidatus Acidoferrales bacterium]
MTSRRHNTFWVYIMTNHSRTLYTGVTNDILRRVAEHKRGEIAGFTQRYRLVRLAYFESFASIRDAIVREKQIKGWLRRKKVALIHSGNPRWKDLAADWPCDAVLHREYNNQPSS